MLLTLRTTHTPATDLGYLLHKHPDRLQTFELPFGKVHVFYPEATATECTAALLLDVDPVGLVRGGGTEIDQYVNDRPYVASSFLAVAIARVLGTALGGRCPARPELVEMAIPLEARLAALPCRGGEGMLRRLFEPLGYTVTAENPPLDPKFPTWGASRYFTVTLRATCRLCDLLSHLYVLIPVLDDDKHYWVGDPEAEKLVRRGEGWLATHPEREMIARRYLRHQRALVQSILSHLTSDEPGIEGIAWTRDAEETFMERPLLRLHDLRLAAVAEVLLESGAKRVIDLGCGDGKLLTILAGEPGFEEIAGMDVDSRSLEFARERLDRLPPAQRSRIQLLHGSLMYRDRRLEGFDAASAVEVVEHLDPPRLAAFERVVFDFARPGTVVLTTPNAEYNVRWPALPAGHFRHRDHRFEWTREQLHAWAEGVASRFGYTVRYLPVGGDDPEVGPPTQMGIFTRGDRS
jgi:3' terminal RNA ribose 2'-O-methyltransferase Hen1